MPSRSYTNPGNYSWTAPFAVKNVTARVIGGGASGYRDCDGDDEGGGGGGGGFAESTRVLSQGQTLSITIASGGSSLVVILVEMVVHHKLLVVQLMFVLLVVEQALMTLAEVVEVLDLLVIMSEVVDLDLMTTMDKMVVEQVTLVETLDAVVMAEVVGELT